MSLFPTPCMPHAEIPLALSSGVCGTQQLQEGGGGEEGIGYARATLQKLLIIAHAQN